MISFRSSFENTNVVVSEAKSQGRLNPKIFIWITASVAEATAVNPKGTKTLLAIYLSSFPIKSRPVICNGPRSLPRSLPNCIMLDSWVFENFILADEPFAKPLEFFETCVLVNNNLWEN